MVFSSPEPKGIQIWSNEGLCPFPMEDNNEIAKLHSIWQNFKIFFSKTTGPISTKLVTKHSWLKGTYVFFVFVFVFYKYMTSGDNVVFTLNQYYGIIITLRKCWIDWNCFSCARCGPWSSYCVCCSVVNLQFTGWVKIQNVQQAKLLPSKFIIYNMTLW